MTANRSSGRKTRTWPELRRRVLEEGYLDIPELERRKAQARLMKHAIWVLPLALVVLAAILILDGLSLLTVVAVGLLCFGAISSFRTGSCWESRWDELIHERSVRSIGVHVPASDRADDLRALLSDPWVTDQRVHRAGDDRMYVWVSEVRDVAEGRFPAGADVERSLDELVEAAGGERIDMIDPWRAGANLLRRLLGRPVIASDALYAIPRSEIEGAESEP